MQAELDKRTEDDLDELAERDDELEKSKTQNNESGNETSENEYEGIDHGDYFNKQRGRARVVQGDDAFDEEMGGVSQMIAATTKMAVQNMYSSDDDASYEEDEAASDTKPDVKPKPKSIQSRADYDATGEETAGTASAARNKGEDEEKKDSEEKPAHANNPLSPEPSTGTQSLGSIDGLRTQHEPTPKSSLKKKAAPAKYSLMGVAFDKTPKKKESEKKKPSGLYIPKY